MFSTWKNFQIIKNLDPGRLGEKKNFQRNITWLTIWSLIMQPPLHHQAPDGHKHAQYCTAYELFLLLEWIQDNKMWIKCGPVSRLLPAGVQKTVKRCPSPHSQVTDLHRTNRSTKCQAVWIIQIEAYKSSPVLVSTTRHSRNLAQLSKPLIYFLLLLTLGKKDVCP